MGVRAAAAAVVTTALDVDRLTGPLVLAFASDPMVRWMLPDPDRFLVHFPVIVQVHAMRVVEHGGAFHTPGFRAAALWYPPGVEVDGAAIGAVFERSVAPDRAEVVAEVFGRMAPHKPAGPHWYLRQVGVDPAAQGRGYGSLLLRAGLDACDRAGLPAYLEATTPANRRLYERFGFAADDEVQVADSPTLWPMTRPARAGAA